MVYFGQYGRKHLYKFGETKNLIARLCNIRNYSKDKSFHFLRVHENSLTKTQEVFIESYIRLQYENLGYEIIGHDHIRGNKNLTDLFDRFYDEGYKMAVRK